MSEKDKVPDGYEIKADMFGLPYLQRKPSPTVRKWAERLFVPYLVVLGIVLYLILR